MNNIKLTIGISTIPNRILNASLLPKLLNKLIDQTKNRDDVEIIILGDNKKITIGKKRDRLVQMAQGKFIVLIDDDDDISEDYVDVICQIIDNNKNIDVISYMQIANINGENWTVDFSLDYNKEHPLNQLEYIFDEQQNIIGKQICKRPPFPVCPFRTELAKKCRFIDFQSSEDVLWARKLWKLCKKEYKLNKIMHIYNWYPNISELPLLSPDGAIDVNE